jgi:hypothetical protein
MAGGGTCTTSLTAGDSWGGERDLLLLEPLCFVVGVEGGEPALSSSSSAAATLRLLACCAAALTAAELARVDARLELLVATTGTSSSSFAGALRFPISPKQY